MAGLLVTAIGLAAAVSCAPEVAARPVPAAGPAEPTPQPRAISLPADEGAHSDNLEWWYYNGHLVTESGGSLGFHFVVFQSSGPDGTVAYVSQFGLTARAEDEHVHDARFAVGRQEPPAGPLLELDVGGWSLRVNGQEHALRALSAGETGGAAIDLTLVPGPEPMLHNGGGWIGGETGWTYYYSWPRMQVEGTVKIGGLQEAVTGLAWMDHQWGDFFVLGRPAGWQWFALQLDGGPDLMLQEFRNADGLEVEAFGTALETGDSAAQAVLLADEYSIETTSTWTSPHTGGIYPAGWTVLVPSMALDLKITPVVADQEITGGVPPAAIYWEGQVEVAGMRGGEAVRGLGYVELTGYAPTPLIGWMRR
jgi:predicted secreted hydrolase